MLLHCDKQSIPASLRLLTPMNFAPLSFAAIKNRGREARQSNAVVLQIASLLKPQFPDTDRAEESGHSRERVATQSMGKTPLTY
jgi:hypothetical protein